MGIRTALGCVALVACGDNLPSEERLGGETTIDDRSVQAFTHFAANLTDDDTSIARAGRGPFDFQWEVPQLGPLFNNNSCVGCHGNNGRGLSMIDSSAPVSQALIRISFAAGTPEVPGGDVPVPILGLQLQDHATFGLPEIYVTQGWKETGDSYGDGEAFTLRAPVLAITTPSGDGLPAGALTSYRQAPPLIGLGLLDAIDEATLTALEDPDDADGDGISGRLNHVWDDEHQVTTIGRFGWKANAATLRDQVAGAFVNDIGLTNKLFPEPNGQRDVSDDQLEQTAFFAATIGVPRAAPRSDEAWRGRRLFDDFHCAGCHVPTFVTGDSAIAEVAHQTIHPYTDLLLHDMGDPLSDKRRDFEAEGNEWRTPPLWGIGLAQIVQAAATFLHDGRARTLAEAILWHGGEAMAAREAFRTASKADREALIAFLMTL